MKRRKRKGREGKEEWMKDGREKEGLQGEEEEEAE